MIRVAALLLLAAPAAAQPTDEALRALAIAGDTGAVEAAFDAAHEEVRAGTLAHDDLRAMTSALIVSDPRLADFARAWIAAEPESPHALAVRAFQLNGEAWRLRGEGLGQSVWPDAMAAARDRWSEAAALAIQAYELAPDHAPASDAVLRLQLPTRLLPPDGFEAFVERVVSATGDAGSLARAQSVSRREWGGGGPAEVAARCERLAPLVTLEGYDEAACYAHAVFHEHFPEARYHAAETVLRGPQSLFEPYWLQAAVMASSLVDPAEIERRLQAPDFTDIETAKSADMMDPPTSADDSIYYQTLARRYDAAREVLAYDPMNIEAIDWLLEIAPMRGTEAAAKAPGDEEREALALRRIEAAPYDPVSWRALVEARRGGLSPWPLDRAAEVAGWNAVVYSGYSAHLLDAYAWERGEVIARAEEDLAAGLLTPDQHRTAVDASLCPLVRADRFLREVCQRGGPGAWACGDVNFAAPDWQPALDLAQAEGLCTWDRNAPLSMIAFHPRLLPASR